MVDLLLEFQPECLNESQVADRLVPVVVSGKAGCGDGAKRMRFWRGITRELRKTGATVA